MTFEPWMRWLYAGLVALIAAGYAINREWRPAVAAIVIGGSLLSRPEWKGRKVQDSFLR